MISIADELLTMQGEAETWSAGKLLRWAFTRFHPRMAVASSFGAEDVVLIDIAAGIEPGLRVFTLDTDFLFPETYRLLEQVKGKYGVAVERTRPMLTPEEQEARHGQALWSREPNLCCQIRKVDPLRAKLAELDAWATGIRRDQTPARANAKKLDWDAAFGLVKLNPLADWTSSQIWDYIRVNDVPYNPLHDHHYPSVGCTHCTRPVAVGEDPRAGRWAGFVKTECGLHAKE
ncbi:MAG TPA: phosphoadenylyl-sulfate reductase [Candidatus Dormibacteraeota bacterium]|nr:phosphoadenylyl-sulfate reductase [Candidatus Dormibacteraeota bacterium]